MHSPGPSKLNRIRGCRAGHGSPPDTSADLHGHAPRIFSERSPIPPPHDAGRVTTSPVYVPSSGDGEVLLSR